VSVYIFHILGSEYSFRDGFKINKTLFAVLVILYPLVDLLRVFILRIKEGKSPFVADQNHIHHMLSLKKKLGPFKTILLINIFVVLIVLFCLMTL
jgi:UDP-N-acetylmuramyl pentapeptide phosphotransferase/UDP-N-acetylglucosamine-1-phosphate transferase